MDVTQFLCDKTKQMWRYYLLQPSEEHYAAIIASWSDHFTMIGTGKHEMYTSAKAAIQSIAENQQEAVQFDLLDEWYEGAMLNDTTCIVYGGVWVREHEANASKALIEMDTRFSIVYILEPNGEWKMAHLHHSMPYFDQGDHEYYPKALSTKVREALELVALFKRRSELDLMTAVYNHDSFQQQVEALAQKEVQLCFCILDLDDFKAVNDTYGHQTGDALLKYTAELLKKYFHNQIVGRLGGDEFAVCAYHGCDRRSLEAIFCHMKEEYERDFDHIIQGKLVSFSIGIAQNREKKTTYRELYQRADEALYQAKHQGKNALAWHEDS